MNIKMFVSDLDGTLLNEKSEISQQTADAIKFAQNKGIKFVVASGRSWDTASQLIKKFSIECDFILLNGAEFRDSTGKVIFRQSMLHEKVAQIFNLLCKLNIDFEINTDKGDFSTDTDLCKTAFPMPDINVLFETKPLIQKIFAFSNDINKLEKINNILYQFNDLSITSSAPWNIEITSSNAQKGFMLEKVTSYYGYHKENVVVFGDNKNDETMFNLFPHSRAMKNALPFIKNMAEKIIESNIHNGVANEIYRILKWEI